jgi:hypothetical protein
MMRQKQDEKLSQQHRDAALSRNALNRAVKWA